MQVETEIKTEVRIELKYCERCGALFLRHAGDFDIYCGGCTPAMREMAIPTKRHAREHWNRAMQELRGATCI